GEGGARVVRDQQAQLRGTREAGERAHHVVHALVRAQIAEMQGDELVVREAERATCTLPARGREGLRVDPARDEEGVLRMDAAAAHEIEPLLRRGRDEGVAALRERTLDARIAALALAREGADRERGDERDREGLLQ